MRTLTFELVEIFADLQRKRVAHRNIKPANIVKIEKKQGHLQIEGEKEFRITNFEWAIELDPLNKED